MSKNRRYGLKSHIRFIVFVTLIIVMTVGLGNTLLGLNDVSGESKKTYYEIETVSGDTLWTIAKEHMPEDMDIREAVYELKKINNLNSSGLKEGQKLSIPGKVGR